jgi:hypothetical protein
MTWKGRQFVDSLDHGREFQSATSFFARGECFNPTEAGARADWNGSHTTSKLLRLEVRGNVLRTESLMAFWYGPNGPNERPGGCPGPISAISTIHQPLSGDRLVKTVSIGVPRIPNAIKYEATFRIPENRTNGGFEVLAAYMPGEFSTFFTYDIAHDQLAPLSDGPGNQPLPIIFSTIDKEYAMGIYSPGGDGHSSAPLYGRWRFAEPSRARKIVKNNCYFLAHDVAAGDHTFVCYFVVGSLAQVRTGMQALKALVGKP